MLVDGTFHCADDTHIRVDTTNEDEEHAIEIRVREDDESDQITQSEDAGEEACLDGITINQRFRTVSVLRTPVREREKTMAKVTGDCI